MKQAKPDNWEQMIAEEKAKSPSQDSDSDSDSGKNFLVFKPKIKYTVTVVDANQRFGTADRLLEAGPQTAEPYHAPSALLNRLYDEFQAQMNLTYEEEPVKKKKSTSL